MELTDTKPMRVIQLINTLDIADGGPARNSFELNLALNETGQADARLVWLNGDPQASVVADYNLPLPSRPPVQLRMRSSGLKSISLGEFIRELRTSNLVIIHGYFLWWVPLAVLICLVFRVPLLLTPHGALTERQQRFSMRRKRVFEICAGWIVRGGVDTFVMGSEIERRELLEAYPGLSVAVGGVGTRPPREDALERGRHYPLRLLVLARLAPKKRIDLSILALKHLLDSGHDAVLTIAGQGSASFTQSLIELVENEKLTQKVSFSGLVIGADKEELYSKSDIYVLPSEDENFGISLAEALAHGLPSVISDYVAAGEGMPLTAGRRVSELNPKAVGEAVLELASSPNFSLARQSAADFARRTYSWSDVATRWIDIMRKVDAHAGQ